jgi:hypothetical protein
MTLTKLTDKTIHQQLKKIYKDFYRDWKEYLNCEFSEECMKTLVISYIKSGFYKGIDYLSNDIRKTMRKK